MNGKKAIGAALVALFVMGAVFFERQRWSNRDPREDVLAPMPASANAVFFVDVADLRASAFLAQLYAWAPKPPMDAEYAQFSRDTGFDYERDLNRVAIAILKRENQTAFFVVAQGQFDRQKIESYALKAGAQKTGSGSEFFAMPADQNQRATTFSFLRNDTIALAVNGDLNLLKAASAANSDAKEWQERFRRLAGSPVFAVLHQDAMTASALASQAPGGFQSPQLAALLGQLQWISVAGKPEGNELRVVADGEAASEETTKQLADVLNGILTLAQAGLDGPKTRQELAPDTREAYLEVLRSADVSRIDRVSTKSVRLIFDITPKLLEAARAAPPITPATSQQTDPKPASHGRRAHR